MHLFVSPTYHHYYFGDYYGPECHRDYYYACRAYGGSQSWYDPFSVYYQHLFRRQGVDYLGRVQGWHSYYVRHADHRPAHTYRAQLQQRGVDRLVEQNSIARSWRPSAAGIIRDQRVTPVGSRNWRGYVASPRNMSLWPLSAAASRLLNVTTRTGDCLVSRLAARRTGRTSLCCRSGRSFRPWPGMRARTRWRLSASSRCVSARPRPRGPADIPSRLTGTRWNRAVWRGRVTGPVGHLPSDLRVPRSCRTGRLGYPSPAIRPERCYAASRRGALADFPLISATPTHRLQVAVAR